MSTCIDKDRRKKNTWEPSVLKGIEQQYHSLLYISYIIKSLSYSNLLLKNKEKKTEINSSNINKIHFIAQTFI
jgi:hypothetical protein